MPPKKTTDSAEGPNGLTDGELRFIKAIFDNMTQKPDADWTRVAGDIGLKDAKCAKERFRQMSVRHGWREQGAASTPRKNKAATPATEGKITKKPRTPRKKTKKEEASDDETVKQEADVKSENGDAETEMS